MHTIKNKLKYFLKNNNFYIIKLINQIKERINTLNGNN